MKGLFVGCFYGELKLWIENIFFNNFEVLLNILSFRSRQNFVRRILILNFTDKEIQGCVFSIGQWYQIEVI